MARTQTGRGALWAAGARLARFLVVGLTGVVVNSVALVLLRDGARLPLLLASGMAAEMAIVNNFVWNDRWTFGRAHLSVRRFLRFNLVSLGGALIATAVLWTLVTLVGVELLAANCVGIALGTAWNFLGNAAWTWQRAPAEEL